MKKGEVRVGILLENDGLASQATKDWADSLVDLWNEANPQVRNYMRDDDYRWFGALIDPNLTDLIVSSAFEHVVDFACQLSFSSKRKFRVDDEQMLQVEYFSYLIRRAVMWRKKNNLPKLTLHVNYLYDDLFKDLEEGKLGDGTKSNILTTIRQAEGWLTVKCYKDYKHTSSIIEEDADYKHELIKEG